MIKNDYSDIEKRLANIEEELTNMYQTLMFAEGFIYLSDINEIWTTTTELTGLGVAVTHSGYGYNFRGIGTLAHCQTLVNGTTYYLIQSSQYPDLSLHQGEKTTGTLWIETPDKENIPLPIHFDKTGIYFTPIKQLPTLPARTTFQFTQTLILVTPNMLLHQNET